MFVKSIKTNVRFWEGRWCKNVAPVRCSLQNTRLSQFKTMWKNRCQNGFQKITKWTKNESEIYKTVEGTRGKERTGRGKVRRGEGKACKERKGTKGRSAETKGGAWPQPRRTGGGLSYLKGGDPSLHQPGYFLGGGPPRKLLFPIPIFASMFDDILITF